MLPAATPAYDMEGLLDRFLDEKRDFIKCLLFRSVCEFTSVSDKLGDLKHLDKFIEEEDDYDPMSFNDIDDVVDDDLDDEYVVEDPCEYYLQRQARLRESLFLDDPVVTAKPCEPTVTNFATSVESDVKSTVPHLNVEKSAKAAINSSPSNESVPTKKVRLNEDVEDMAKEPVDDKPIKLFNVVSDQVLRDPVMQPTINIREPLLPRINQALTHLRAIRNKTGNRGKIKGIERWNKSVVNRISGMTNNPFPDKKISPLRYKVLQELMKLSDENTPHVKIKRNDVFKIAYEHLPALMTLARLKEDVSDCIRDPFLKRTYTVLRCVSSSSSG